MIEKVIEAYETDIATGVDKATVLAHATRYLMRKPNLDRYAQIKLRAWILAKRGNV